MEKRTFSHAITFVESDRLDPSDPSTDDASMQKFHLGTSSPGRPLTPSDPRKSSNSMPCSSNIVRALTTMAA